MPLNSSNWCNATQQFKLSQLIFNHVNNIFFSYLMSLGCWSVNSMAGSGRMPVNCQILCFCWHSVSMPGISHPTSEESDLSSAAHFSNLPYPDNQSTIHLSLFFNTFGALPRQLHQPLSPREWGVLPCGGRKYQAFLIAPRNYWWLSPYLHGYYVKSIKS